MGLLAKCSNKIAEMERTYHVFTQMCHDDVGGTDSRIVRQADEAADLGTPRNSPGRARGGEGSLGLYGFVAAPVTQSS